MVGQQGQEEEAEAYFDEKQIEINKKVAEKAASDADFRAHLMKDPESALQEAGLADEAASLVQQSAEEAGEEVTGHWHRTYYRTCRYWSYGILWHWR